MVSPVLRIALEVPGRLLWDAKTFTGSFPFDGTELGFVGGITLQPREATQDITDPTTGRVIDSVYTADGAVLSCQIRDMDNDALERVFLNTIRGPITQRRRVDFGGTVAGSVLSARTGTLTFVPEAIINGNDDIHRMVHFYRVMSRQPDAFETLLRMGSKAEVPIEFIALPDISGSGDIGWWSFLGDQP